MIKLRIFVTSLLLLSSGFLLGAEDSPEMAVSSSSIERWYRVELLIYKQKPIPGKVEEVWPHVLSLDYPATWVKLKTQEEYIADPNLHPVLASWLARIKSSPYTPFVLQADVTKSFTKAAKQIERFEDGVLFHGVWWQPFIQNDASETPAILIKAGKLYGDHAELEGSISFQLSRYLHISTNLWLTEFALDSETESNTPSQANSWPALPISPDLPVLQASDSIPADMVTLVGAEKPESYVPNQVILIKQNRRMRSDETHYIDHPKLGIVVRLTPQPEKK